MSFLLIAEDSAELQNKNIFSAGCLVLTQNLYELLLTETTWVLPQTCRMEPEGQGPGARIIEASI